VGTVVVGAADTVGDSVGECVLPLPVTVGACEGEPPAVSVVGAKVPMTPCWVVGASVVGDSVGDTVGDSVGECVTPPAVLPWWSVGASVVGDSVGDRVGDSVGECVAPLPDVVGACEGEPPAVSAVGAYVPATPDASVGASVVGDSVGDRVGDSVGECVWSWSM
jgi:hypothetical protein